MEANSLASAPALALRFEFGDIGRRRHGGFAGGHQEIPRVTRLHLDPIADLAEVRDLLQQYDMHVSRRFSADRCTAARPRSARAGWRARAGAGSEHAYP